MTGVLKSLSLPRRLCKQLRSVKIKLQPQCEWVAQVSFETWVSPHKWFPAEFVATVGCGQGHVSSLRDSPYLPILPGTDVPGYRLFRPYGTGLLRLIEQTRRSPKQRRRPP